MLAKAKKAWDEAEEASNEAGRPYKDRWDTTGTFLKTVHACETF